MSAIQKFYISLLFIEVSFSSFACTMKPLNSGHLFVLKNLSVIKRFPLLRGSLTKMATFGTKHFPTIIDMSAICNVRFWEVLL